MINFKSKCTKCQQYRNGCDILERLKCFSDDIRDRIVGDISCMEFKKLENPCPKCSHEKVCQFKNSDEGDCLYYEEKSLQDKYLCDSCCNKSTCWLKVNESFCVRYKKAGGQNE